MLSRSISSVNHTIVRHEFSIPALSSLATGGRARGLDRSTNAHPTALEARNVAKRSGTTQAEARAKLGLKVQRTVRRALRALTPQRRLAA
jgi:hypothetical protein